MDELLNILCCPESKMPLVKKGEYLISTSKETRRKYPIKNGIPILIIEESEVLNYDEWNNIIANN